MLSFADTILQEDITQIRSSLHYGVPINDIDEYGFTPLIESAIIDNIQIATLLLNQGALVNRQDVTGGTALHWAIENNDIEFCKLLFSYHANPNAYNFAGQPALVMAILRQQTELKKFLIKAGADVAFAKDYIDTKLLGHMYELIGTANIVSPNNEFVEVNFEGFFLEVTLGILADALAQFQNHFAARKLRKFSGLASYIVQIILRASTLIKYNQYRVDTSKYQDIIDATISEEPLIIPVGYEGHAITFIKYGNTWVKCDRREDSRLYDNIMFYQVGNPEQLTKKFIKKLIFQKNDDQFINKELDHILGLRPMTELKVSAQVSGNCSWANVEATIPALFFLILMESNKNSDTQAIAYYKTLALNFFTRFREWNKERTLNFLVQNYQEGDPVRKACKAEIIAAILFQCCDLDNRTDQNRIEYLLSILAKSPYEYILLNYLRVYYYEGYTEKGKRFYELLKEHEIV